MCVIYFVINFVIKDVANEKIQNMCDGLHAQIKRLQQQIQDLQSSPHRVTVTHHETTTTTDKGGVASGHDKEGGDSGQGAAGGSTTMIFGSMSENLLLTILQRLQELYSEISAGRADSNVATR